MANLQKQTKSKHPRINLIRKPVPPRRHVTRAKPVQTNDTTSMDSAFALVDGLLFQKYLSDSATNTIVFGSQSFMGHCLKDFSSEILKGKKGG